MSPSRFVVLGILLGLPACGNDSTGPPAFATVVFSYIAPTATDPAVAAMFPQCVQGVNVTHLHAGWSDFQAFPLTAMGPDRWEITFINVPVASEQRIRISDPNTCALNADWSQHGGCVSQRHAPHPRRGHARHRDRAGPGVRSGGERERHSVTGSARHARHARLFDTAPVIFALGLPVRV